VDGESESDSLLKVFDANTGSHEKSERVKDTLALVPLPRIRKATVLISEYGVLQKEHELLLQAFDKQGKQLLISQNIIQELKGKSKTQDDKIEMLKDALGKQRLKALISYGFSLSLIFVLIFG